MDNTSRRAFLETTIREAGQILLQHFGHTFADRAKDGDPHSVVTAADMAAHHYIEARIATHFPDDKIVSEEDEATHGNASADRVWIIDPLDGTRNFASRVPLFGVLIAYAEQGEVILSAIYLPTTDELAIAEKGRGATLNGEPMYASTHADFASSYGMAQTRPGRAIAVKFSSALLASYPDITPWANSLGCVAVTAMYLADGRRDWYATRGAKIWDYAAPSLVLKEAGCVVTNSNGEPWTLADTELIAANPFLHAEVLRLANA